MIWRFDVDFGIDFWVVDIQNSGYSPIFQFSIVLHFPMCSVERNPFCATWGGYGVVAHIERWQFRNEFAISSMFHVIALPWLWNQRVPVNFFPAASRVSDIIRY